MHARAVNTGADIVVAGRRDVDADTHELLSELRPPLFGSIAPRQLAQYWVDLSRLMHSACSKLYRGELVQQFRGELDEVPDFQFSGADTVFVMTLLRNCRSVASIPEPLYEYRIRPTSLFKSRFALERVDAYDNVHRQVRRLLDSWNATPDLHAINDAEHVVRVGQAILIAEHASHELPESRCALVARVFDSQALIDCWDRIDESQKVHLWVTAHRAVSTILAPLTEAERARCEESWLVRQLEVLDPSGVRRTEREHSAYFASMFHPANRLRLGRHFAAVFLLDVLGSFIPDAAIDFLIDNRDVLVALLRRDDDRARRAIGELKADEQAVVAPLVEVMQLDDGRAAQLAPLRSVAIRAILASSPQDSSVR
jgi:hypothetical protein